MGFGFVSPSQVPGAEEQGGDRDEVGGDVLVAPAG